MSSFVISKCGHINAAGFSFGITPQSKISLHGNTLLTMAYRLQAETASAVFFRLISRYVLKIFYRKNKPLHKRSPLSSEFAKFSVTVYAAKGGSVFCSEMKHFALFLRAKLL